MAKLIGEAGASKKVPGEVPFFVGYFGFSVGVAPSKRIEYSHLKWWPR
jgi:hypothetical protein